MEENHPERTSSFSRIEEKPSESDYPSNSIIKEEEEEEKEKEELIDEEKKKDDKEEEKDEELKEADFNSSFQKISKEINQFLNTIVNIEENKDDVDRSNPFEVPDLIEKFMILIENEIAKYDVVKDYGRWGRDSDNDESSSFLEAVDKVSKLMNAFAQFPSEPQYVLAVHRTSNVLHRAMLFLEEEFKILLEDFVSVGDTGPDDLKTKQMSLSSYHEPDQGESDYINFSGFEPETIPRMAMITKAMIAVGYETECCQIFTIMQRHAFDDNLSKIGCEKISIDDIQKMQWEALEGEILTWINACKQCLTVYLPGERKFSESVFADHPSISADLYSNLARIIINQLLNFVEAVAMTKRSAEKLFKFLDIYETFRDFIKALDGNDLFPGGTSPELISEVSYAHSQLVESAVMIFSDLENSIKSDHGKTPVPGGAVHPLTRYVMNYVKYTCEYKETLEHVFREQKQEDNDDSSVEPNESINASTGHAEKSRQSPFSIQMMTIMDLLDSNLDGKSKLYKDISLRYIFLMNNGRYIMQKIKGSPEIKELLGDKWCRKRSSNLQQYHKNYQRETWGRVLGCLRDEGLLQGKGVIVKPTLKERFKSFNALFDEIHKTQSMWVVSDEQLQSELRVSISAVVIPAYRSFLARFQQYLDPGRQTEKYIKYGPEEIETCVEELFGGTPASMVRRR
ncbi:exocyst complex component EXO70B1-like [Magnolia sinica]|uniref:exocyst complex component EXO70B1-like n=1 Tax=Magnolia sinica TaxID=86752 RepID=UPI00265ABC9B|nr:exocyst complex component EXO70B1-like [Magnolia sinica]